MKKSKYIAHLSTEELEKNIVISCINEEGYHSILIRNAVEKSVTTKYTTDNMTISLDSILFLEDKKYYFHIITTKNKDIYSIGQFKLIYEYIFKNIDVPQLASELNNLVISLEEYFKITPEKDYLNMQIGIFGELLSIKYIYDVGYKDIVKKYHKNFYSKHDIEINENLRIEIKASIKEKRIHNFKHNQIFRKDVKVFVFSLLLEESQEGYSLYNMFEEMKKLCTSPEEILSLNKLMKKCNVTEKKQGLRISLNKAINDFKVYSSTKLPRIDFEIPNGVTNVQYEVDCSLATEENIEEFVEMLKNLNNN